MEELAKLYPDKDARAAQQVKDRDPLNDELRKAALKGEAATVEKLLADGANPNDVRCEEGILAAHADARHASHAENPNPANRTDGRHVRRVGFAQGRLLSGGRR